MWIVSNFTTQNILLSSLAVKELGATGKFSYMQMEEDEAEHSIEMHLPYVRKIFEK